MLIPSSIFIILDITVFISRSSICFFFFDIFHFFLHYVHLFFYFLEFIYNRCFNLLVLLILSFLGLVPWLFFLLFMGSIFLLLCMSDSFLLLLLFNGCTHGIWKFLGQRLNLSLSCDLCYSCGNTRSFNPLCWAGNRTYTSSMTPSCWSQDS